VGTDNDEAEAPATPPVERRAEELGERQQQPEAQPRGGAPERAAEQQPHQAHGPPPPQQDHHHQQQQQDHEIEGPAKLLNYIIIALFFAIVAVVMRKLTN
jgi:hypothetical protein